MRISRMTVDKLGVKLYDRVSAVIAELVANSYDADATQVRVYAPMGAYLTQKNGTPILGTQIIVEDDGIGMTSEEVNDFYLRVGAERRQDPLRGGISKKFSRKVMGRKGVGKLAPFGICQKIEIITAGGDEITEKQSDGSIITGYKVSHLILDRSNILIEDDNDYIPEIGTEDNSVIEKSLTKIILSNFIYRFVPTLNDLERQLAQRFGIESHSWKIGLHNTIPQSNLLEDSYREVGKFNIPQMAGTGFSFKKNGDSDEYIVEDMNGNIRLDLIPGFMYENKMYPIIGWAGYSETPYKDDLMAGIRVYCRGKIAAQTHIFNMKAGFTGEYDIRSYLVGEIHADWLDEEEDLIQTDRRDILWSDPLGQAFEAWGQNLVKKIGAEARNPIKRKSWETFRKASNIDEHINQAFPLPDQKPIREQTIELAKMIGQTMRQDEASNEEYIKEIVELSINLAPHLTLDAKLREVADSQESPLSVITGILKAARVAELSSFGLIAEERIRVIHRVEELKDDPQTLEDAFQDLIENAPWLINPQWVPITSNQTFTTLKREFEKYYHKETGQTIQLSDFVLPNKRADFVLSNHDGIIEIIEIKRPDHAIKDDEWERIINYNQQMENFLKDPINKDFVKSFSIYHITLVCDRVDLKPVAQSSFDGLKSRGILTHIDWRNFLIRTRQMHQEFLNEADRQKRILLQRQSSLSSGT